MATAPAPAPTEPPAPAPAPAEPPPKLEGYQGNPFNPEWRSALDDPEHPLHHLRAA